jgi:hypothetical protein
MKTTTIVVTHEPDPELTSLTGHLQGIWWGMKDLAKTKPSRELSLAITNAQQALMWMVECSYLETYRVPAPESTTATVSRDGEAIADIADQPSE